MAKSQMKALEENAALRRENKRLHEEIAAMRARIDEMKNSVEVNMDGAIHS